MSYSNPPISLRVLSRFSNEVILGILFANRRKLLKVFSAVFLITVYLGAEKLAEPGDKYQWLEDVWCERSLAWVGNRKRAFS